MEAAHTHPLPVLLVIRVMRQREVSLRLLKLDLPMDMTLPKLKKDQVGALQVIITMGRRQDNKDIHILTSQILQLLIAIPLTQLSTSSITRPHRAYTRTTKPSNLTRQANSTKKSTILISLLTPRPMVPILMTGQWQTMP